jgi:hypothetical protein
VIMDGNGRWAQQRGLPRIMGHRRGVDTLKQLLRRCSDWGIEALTAYAFSTENWGRPLEEVGFLMTLFERVLRQELTEMMAENVRIQFVGNLSACPIPCRGRLSGQWMPPATTQAFASPWPLTMEGVRKFSRPVGRSRPECNGANYSPTTLMRISLVAISTQRI